MGYALVVTTPSALAVELIAEIRARDERGYKVYSLGEMPGIVLPPGSTVVAAASYTDFLAYVDANDVSEIVFAAKLHAGLRFWTEAILNPRFWSKLRASNWRMSAGLLLELVEEDLQKRDIIIKHPHEISPAFRLASMDQLGSSLPDITNQIRTFIALESSQISHSLIIVRESRLYGLTHANHVKHIATEFLDTALLMRCLKWKRKNIYQRIVLYKTHRDHTQLSYPVIGEMTVSDAARHGITDIAISANCVIQGKHNMLNLARRHNISVRVLA